MGWAVDGALSGIRMVLFGDFIEPDRRGPRIYVSRDVKFRLSGPTPGLKSTLTGLKPCLSSDLGTGISVNHGRVGRGNLSRRGNLGI